MKSSQALPVLTAIIGFAAAWIAKPQVHPPAGTHVQAPGASGHPAKGATEPLTPTSSRKRPAEVKAGDFPLADRADQGPKSREEAKMLRLTEALGLTFEQQGALIKLVQDVQATDSGGVPVLTDLATRGKAVEDGLKEILDATQLAKFQEMRTRERENRAELRAHQMLAQAIEEIDLSPEQREQALERLRQKSKEDFQTIPAAATLFFEKSMLPTGGKELSVDGVLALAKAGEPITGSDPMQVHQRIMDDQRRELERMLTCFDGILTPAQMGQYEAGIAEQRRLIERMAVQKHLDMEKRVAPGPAAPPFRIEEVPDDQDPAEDE